jgi:hypothetical protein
LPEDGKQLTRLLHSRTDKKQTAEEKVRKVEAILAHDEPSAW